MRGNLRFSKLYRISVYSPKTGDYTEYSEICKGDKANKSMGEMISTRRKEKGMTQKELADQLNLTDKAVSKWERDVAYPDTGTLPKLAEILEVSVEELLNSKSVPSSGHKGADFFINIVLKAVPAAMGIAVVVTSAMGELDTVRGFMMLGMGLACVGIYLLKNQD